LRTRKERALASRKVKQTIIFIEEKKEGRADLEQSRSKRPKDSSMGVPSTTPLVPEGKERTTRGSNL